jgi:hypothetical protein
MALVILVSPSLRLYVSLLLDQVRQWFFELRELL